MLGWAVYVSHNKASHKGVALSLTSSHLTARHGQVVCMETRLRACVHVCECVCACTEVQTLPTLLSSGEAEISPSSLPLSLLYLECFSETRLLSFLLCTTLTFNVSVFICPSPSIPLLLSISVSLPLDTRATLTALTNQVYRKSFENLVFFRVCCCSFHSEWNKHQWGSASFWMGMWFVQSYKLL